MLKRLWKTVSKVVVLFVGFAVYPLIHAAHEMLAAHKVGVI